MDDLRRQRMDSAEGLGKAFKVWTGYSAALGFVRPASWDRAFSHVGERLTMENMGFWLCWHFFGGFEGMRRAGRSRATIYRHLKRFRVSMKCHPDEYVMPGVDIEPAAFWSAVVLPVAEEAE
ncbi:MAG: hypothetical protein ABIJ48_11660 [Actinomycetota bacterium]